MEPPISPAMARSANSAVPPSGILEDEILMVPGPFVIGFVTQNTDDDLKAGMLAGCIFPAVLILSVFLLRQRNAEQK